MIKVSVLYPNKPGSHFDMAYYTTKHMPLAMKLLANGLHKTEVDAGLQGRLPDSRRPFSAVASSTSIPSMRSQRSGDRRRRRLRRIFPRYTDVQPIIQFNEVKLSL